MSDELKAEVEAAIGGLSHEDLERMSNPRAQTGRGEGRGKIRGTICDIRGGDVFVDVGGKAEAFLSIDEFDHDNPAKVGDAHTFVMQGMDAESGMMRLSLREARMAADFESLRPGDVIEGRVTGVNVGGLELQAKGLRAFMPKSQVDMNRIEDFAPFIGRRLEVEITEIDRKAHTLVVSRRRILDRQREQARQEIKYTLAEGQTRKGVVRRITDFGAFVDIGGIEGLLHVGDLSYGRVKHTKDLLKEGQEVEVQVLKIDHAKDRIALGMKQLATDPWTLVEGNFRVGDTVDGRVTKLMDFGAFVELTPGVEGLIPVSEMSWTHRVRHPKDVLGEADAVRVAVMAVDLEKRKISLSLKALGQDPWKTVVEKYPPDSVHTGLVMRLADFGAFIQLEEGVEGLAHISELSERRIKMVGEAVRVGQVVQARIKTVDPEQRRISLTLRTPTVAPSASDVADAQLAAATAPLPAKKKKKALKGGLE